MASFTERYHQLTKYNPHTIDKLGPVHWESQPPAFKAISSKEKIDLLTRLQSVMEHLEGEDAGPGNPENPEAGLENIARLLFFTLGLTARLGDQGGGDFFLRAAPSAGGLYPTEIYVAARNQSGLPDGIYHYHSLKSALIPVWQGSFWGDLKHYFLGHPAVEASNLLFLFTGTYGRSAWRYKERAYRRILLDTGHAAGNLIETCRDSQLDYALLGGFLDGGLEELLFLTRKEEFPLLAIAVGPRGSLPAQAGQHPSDLPIEAIKHIDNTDAMQVQQNECERIRALGQPHGTVGDPQSTAQRPHGNPEHQPHALTPAHHLRPPVSAPCGGPPFEPAEYNLLKTILRRRSCRKFNGTEITRDALQEILAYSFRSEGAAWCLAPGHLDFHLIALKVDGLESGVYKLNPNSIALEPKRLGDFKSEAFFMCLGQELAAECAFILVHTSDLARLTDTYGDRGYRYACMDAGQIGQRINLWAVHRNLGSSGIGGYYDDQANELLGLPLSHGILYITLVGVPEEG